MVSHRAAPLLLLWAAVGLPASPAAAQTMRSVTIAKQLRDQTSLKARIDFAAGDLKLTPGAPNNLYRMELDYDADRFLPVGRYDASAGTVELGLDRTGSAGIRVSKTEHLSQSAAVEFAPGVNLALDLELGAVDADLELGGLRLTSARLATAGSRTVARFSSENPGRCDSLKFNAGAADFTAIGLGNSHCREIDFNGGVGAVNLDLTGSWAEDGRVMVELTMGQLTLTLPRNVGFALNMDRFLSSFEPEGFTRSGNSFRSANYQSAERKVSVHINCNVAAVTVKWAD
ncbi:MAG TPA: LiaF domain-containing protein [Gemmatimonadales bacterium]|jgi:hypothetical protein|nr:LiaF domain-containing protein [Gemmatimonadales bacterium]